MQPTAEKNIAILCNPLAGVGRSVVLANTISKKLTAKKYNHQLFTEQWPENFTGFTDIWISGGDGTLNYFINKYQFNTNPVYELDPLIAGNTTLKQWNYPAQKPEALSSFELGYKGLLMDSKLLIDAYGYYGNYTDFTGRIRVVQSKNNVPITPANYASGQIYSVPINYADKINTKGFGLGLDYRLPRNFSVGMNLASDNLDVPSGLMASFNSPKYKLNANFGNSGFGKDKRFGFNMAYRWQDKFYFEGDLATGYLPAVQTVDAQLSYKLPSTKSILKFGANNLLNQYYYNGVGNSYVGGLYYVSFGYNVY